MAGRSKYGRLARIGGLTSKVSSSYLGQRLKGAFQSREQRESALRRLHLSNAEQVVGTMGALKGAAMKIGQSLAVLADGMELPPEIGQIMGKLYDGGEPVAFEEIKATVSAELGGLADFSHIDPEPLGTASLAQAHAAVLSDGSPAVVKVLHEGVADSVDTDIAALRTIFMAGRFLNRSKEEIELVFSEIHERLLEELDYPRELANLVYFHRKLAPLDGISSPRPFPSLCTDRVLVMERMTGGNLDSFLQSATPTARQRAGDVLTSSFHEMLYVLRSLHADPHGGNYLFRSDGSIALIDFGCIRHFTPFFVAEYSRIGDCAVAGDRKGLLDTSRQMGILLPGSPSADDAFWRFCMVIAKPFHAGSYRLGGPEDRLREELDSVVREVLRHPEIRSVRELVYLHRALGGIYAMLRRLGHEGSYGEIRSRYARHAIDVADGRKRDTGWYEGS